MTTHADWKAARSVAALLALLAGTLSATAAPPATGEICDNEVDDDGDGKVDCADRECRDDPSCSGGGGGAYDSPYEVASTLPCLLEPGSCWVSALNGSATRALGGSNAGEEVVYGCTLTRRHVVVWDLDANGAVTDSHELPNPPADRDIASAAAMNDFGMVVGSGFFTPDPEWPCNSYRSRPLAWQESAGTWSVELLPMDGAATGKAQAVDGAGWIAGFLVFDEDGDDVFDPQNTSDHVDAVVWRPDGVGGYSIDYLPRPTGAFVTTAADLNAAGRCVGTASFPDGSGGSYKRAVAWDYDSGTDSWSVEELLTLGGDDAAAVAVNDAGEVVGHSGTGIVETYRRRGSVREAEITPAARWSDASGSWSAPDDLGIIRGPYSWAMAIDGAGRIVGKSTVQDDPAGDRFAALWDGGPPVRLDEQVAGAWIFEMFTSSDIDIAGDGWVVVNGRQSNSGTSEALVLVPSGP